MTSIRFFPMFFRQLSRYSVVVFVGLLTSFAAHAALTIEIVGSGANQIPIAIAPFRAEEGTPQPLTPVIGADLARSGLFKLIDAGGVVPVPVEPGEVNSQQWTARGAEALVIGAVAPAGEGRFE